MLAWMDVEPALLRAGRILVALLVLAVAGLIVALFQPAINGKHRWIVMPHFQVQPSELAKPVLILFLAAFLARREERVNELAATLLPIGCILGVFGGLIVLEDFGTAATIILVAAG